MSRHTLSVAGWRARRGAWAVLCLLAGGAAAVQSAAGTTALDRYLDGLNSLRTAFTQTVTDAQRHRNRIRQRHPAGTAAREVSLGLSAARRRAGRRRRVAAVQVAAVRWQQRRRGCCGAPSAAERGQLLVADGKNLWFYDRELAQVTVKPVAAALSATPVMLLSGSPRSCTTASTSTPAGSHDGLDWVSVKPRSAEADFSQAQLGFARRSTAAHGREGPARADGAAGLLSTASATRASIRPNFSSSRPRVWM